MDCGQVFQTIFFLTGNQSFQRNLDYQEPQNAIRYLANAIVLNRRFVWL